MQPTPQTYDELQRAYTHFNQRLYGGDLPDCLITLQRKKRSPGYFSPNRFVGREGEYVHEIAMNPAYFALVPIETTLARLVHEMGHLWQYEQGTPGRRGYHNREWAEHLKGLGLYPSSTGKPGGAETGEHMADYIVEGGSFIAACRELLATDFTLSWYDRFLPDVLDDLDVPLGSLEEPPAGLDAGEEESLEAERKNLESGDLGAPRTLTAPGEAGAPAAAAPLTRPPAAVGGANFEVATAGSRSNRSKYECPGCKAHVWGRPGLGITCNTCELGFEEV